MMIPDCYDPVYQEEQRQKRWDSEKKTICCCCGDIIDPGSRFHTTRGKAVCRFCVGELEENVEVAL